MTRNRTVALIAMMGAAATFVATPALADSMAPSFFKEQSSRSYFKSPSQSQYKPAAKKKKLKQRAYYASPSQETPGRRYNAGKKPGKWCGWWMRTQKGGGPAYNRAWHWRNYGRASGPQIGAVVVWRHHVGMIVGRAANGRWIVKSGNDGNRVRTRARSVAGAIFRI